MGRREAGLRHSGWFCCCAVGIVPAVDKCAGMWYDSEGLSFNGADGFVALCEDGIFRMSGRSVTVFVCGGENDGASGAVGGFAG